VNVRVPLLGLLAAAGLAILAAAHPVTAPAGPSAHRAGSCWVRLNDDPVEYPSVQAAVDASTRPTDVVKVAGYCAGVERRAGFTQTVYLSKTLTLQGGYTLTNWTAPDPLAHPTTLDALGQGRVLRIDGQAGPYISGLRITGGDAALAGFDPYGQNCGGGLYALDASVTLSGCVIYGNKAARGGGIYTYNSRLTMYGNTVADNNAPFIGGGMLMYEGVGRLEGNVFLSNTAGTGAGAYFGSEAVTLTWNSFLSNTALYDGGGVIVEIYGGHSQLVGNRVAGNRAYWNGGGLYFGEGVLGRLPSWPRGNRAGGGHLMLAGNLIAHNRARHHGGGVFMSGDGGAANFVGNTVLENEAEADGGGIYLDWSADPTPILSNTVGANVAGGNGGGIYLGTGTATLRGNIIHDNRAGGDGGGVYGQGNIAANVIAANTAARRGGGVALSGAATLVNNWLTDNQAGLDGAALSVVAPASRLLHNTIAGRAAGGSAVYVGALPPLSGSLFMTNTILVSHTIGITVAAGCTATLEATLWGNETDWAGPGTVNIGKVNVWGAPAFLDPAGGNYHIGPTSAARDAGVAAGIHTDIDGDPRPFGAGYDIGADEALTPFWIYLPLVFR